MIMDLWAKRWNIPPQAIHEFKHLLSMGEPATGLDARNTDGTETTASQLIRLDAPTHGCRLYRNNVGVLPDVNGRPVRFGLANDSKQVNERIKSSDLIGVMPVVINPNHVGLTLGMFMSIEVKKPGWRFNPNDDRQAAQAKWIQLMIKMGGFAKFATSPADIWGK